MTLTQHKQALAAKRQTSEQSIANLQAKLQAKPRDKLVAAYVAQEIEKHRAIIAAIDADFAAAGIA